MPSAPCPTAGSESPAREDLRRAPLEPEPHEPRAREHDGVASPASTLRRRVSTLPRSGTISRSGRAACSDTARRRLLVPTRAPCGQLGERRRGAAPRARRADPRARERSASASPGGSSPGTSLIECTAKSARRVEQRLLDLLHEEPLAADLGERAILDPVAGRDHLLLDELEARVRRRTRSQNARHCARASAERRVACVSFMISCGLVVQALVRALVRALVGERQCGRRPALLVLDRNGRGGTLSPFIVRGVALALPGRLGDRRSAIEQVVDGVKTTRVRRRRRRSPTPRASGASWGRAGACSWRSRPSGRAPRDRPR